ncbi:spermidine/putrescine ABC transporter substrate-binding protein, partial [Vibrio agarivorans]
MQLTRLLIVSVSLVFSNSFKALATEVHLYNWEEFLSQNVIERLKDKKGITLKQHFFSDESIRDELLASERKLSFDLTVIESVKLNLLAKQGIFHSLNRFKAQLSDVYDKMWLDACGDYGLPYAWGTTGILYRVEKVPKPESWSALLNPAPSLKNKISMYYEPVDLLSTALLANGFEPFTHDLGQIKKAYDTLVHQKTFIA